MYTEFFKLYHSPSYLSYHFWRVIVMKTSMMVYQVVIAINAIYENIYIFINIIMLR